MRAEGGAVTETKS